MKKTLLDLDKVLTLEELQAFFRANDYSTAQFYDKEKLTNYFNVIIKLM